MNNIKIDIDSLMALGIPDLRAVNENGVITGVRGQSLSCRKNRRHLKAVKDAGIETIIDLRTGDYKNDLALASESAGLKYYHIPIDKKRTPAAEIIQRLPLLITAISRGSFYISCMQGLHRTDTALALYFLFNPKACDPPFMYGHVVNGKFKCDEIYGRAGNVYHNLSEEDKKILGWDEEFYNGFALRKKTLTAAQSL